MRDMSDQFQSIYDDLLTMVERNRINETLLEEKRQSLLPQECVEEEQDESEAQTVIKTIDNFVAWNTLVIADAKDDEVVKGSEKGNQSRFQNAETREMKVKKALEMHENFAK